MTTDPKNTNWGQHRGATMNQSNCSNRLNLNRIINGGFCIGCGVCAAYSNKQLRIAVNKYGEYTPYTDKLSDGDLPEEVLKVCPFSDTGENEDTISSRLYSKQENIQHENIVGYHKAVWVGYSSNPQQREMSTSGGLLSWLIKGLISDNVVQAAVCLGPSSAADRLFEYKIVHTEKEVDACSKSKYYPVELSTIIPKIKTNKEKVAVVAPPCIIKALRLAQLVDPELNELVGVAISMFCGQLKTQNYTKYLAQRCGVNPKDLVTAQYRKPIEGSTANDYAFEATYLKDGEEKKSEIRMKDIFGASYSYNLFMPEACNWCDDLIGETGDISVGDAWQGDYPKDNKGTNLIVCRSRQLYTLITKGIKNGELVMNQVPPESVAESQGGAVRHRHNGLQYRLYRAQKKGRWSPPKRFKASNSSLSPFYKLIQILRVKIQHKARESYIKDIVRQDLKYFEKDVYRWILMHDLTYKVRHNFLKIKHLIDKIITLFKIRTEKDPLMSSNKINGDD